MTSNKALKGELDSLVRDACSVVPVSKSEFRNRLLNLIESTANQARIDELSSIPNDPNGLFNYIDDRIAKLIGKEE